LITQASQHINSSLMAELFSDLSEDDSMSFLLVVFLISLFITSAISISPVVDVISLNIIVAVLSLLIILPILISGIINLILIIS